MTTQLRSCNQRWPITASRPVTSSPAVFYNHLCHVSGARFMVIYQGVVIKRVERVYVVDRAEPERYHSRIFPEATWCGAGCRLPEKPSEKKGSTIDGFVSRSPYLSCVRVAVIINLSIAIFPLTFYCNICNILTGTSLLSPSYPHLVCYLW